MSTHTMKYCPKCKRLYQSYSTYTKDYVVSEGCPIVTCKHCGTRFLDKDIKEPAFSSPPKGLNLLQMLLCGFWPFGVAGICLLILGIKGGYGFVVALAFVSFAVYGYLVYICIKNRTDINIESNEDYERSKERLSDKNYVALLIKLGYRVPKKFLKDNFPDLLN